LSPLLHWDRCGVQKDAEVETFVKEYLAQSHRRVLLIAGAGFDPRATRASELLGAHLRERLTGLFIREERPSADVRLKQRADRNLEKMTTFVVSSTVPEIQIFASDNAVVGGREAVKAIAGIRVEDFTDIILDCSALSKGVFFPIVRFLLPKTRGLNFHLLAVDQPRLDDNISPVIWEQASSVHGFRGNLNAPEHEAAARLWLPQLVPGQRVTLDLIFQMVRPHDVCPILPFPSSDPRLPDKLVEAYATEMGSGWQVDPRNVVYADEHSPLDVYRAIVRIHEARKPIFESRGSQIILSPIGGKILSLGALLAALEHDFPVIYVEAIAYQMDFSQTDAVKQEKETLVHVWLEGEAYAQQ